MRLEIIYNLRMDMLPSNLSFWTSPPEFSTSRVPFQII